MAWFNIENVDKIDSPSLVLYEEHLNHNIDSMIRMVDGDLQRLRPHIKTNKMPEVLKRLISAGINYFKASTLAEAEMACEGGADGVLIAHQLVGPKIQRLGDLLQKYPNTKITTLVDNIHSAGELNKQGLEWNVVINVYIDINSGMNRTGIELNEILFELLEYIRDCKNLKFRGLHIYDGHIRDEDFLVRKHKVEDQFSNLEIFLNKIKIDFPELELICGGTPTFSSHAVKKDRITSPGTSVFWDWNYDDMLPEQDFKFAVLIITRVISKPTNGIITIDLGHKSIAPENAIDKRVKFLNLKNYELLSQSEEHGVMRVSDWENVKIGDIFYGVPYHICPTINLHNYVSVVRDRKKVEEWSILKAR